MGIGEFIVDFYCPKARLVVELDGRQHYTPQGLAYDEERSAYLGGAGMKVIRFKNNEVDDAFRLVCCEITKRVEARL
jgi:very-short-patch-repair endonuclease